MIKILAGVALILITAGFSEGCLDSRGREKGARNYAASDFVGTWTTQITNADGVVLRCELVLTKDQKFEMTVIPGTRLPREPFKSLGDWKISGDSLVTVASKSPDKNEINQEVPHRVTSLSADRMTYATPHRVWRWQRQE